MQELQQQVSDRRSRRSSWFALLAVASVAWMVGAYVSWVAFHGGGDTVEARRACGQIDPTFPYAFIQCREAATQLLTNQRIETLSTATSLAIVPVILIWLAIGFVSCCRHGGAREQP